MLLGMAGFVAVFLGIYFGNQQAITGGFAVMFLDTMFILSNVGENIIILNNNLDSLYILVKKKLDDIHSRMD